MKKILTIFAAAVAALSLASCNKDDSVYENNTRTGLTEFVAEYANVDTKSNAKVSETSKVSSFSMAIYRDGAYINNAAAESTFKWDATNSVWGNGYSYYWAKDAKYTYVATLCNNSAAAFGDKADGKVTKTGFEVSTDGTTADYAAGVKTGGIYADAGTSTQQDDPCVAIKKDVQNSDNNKVELTFYHALARLRVEAKATFASTVKLKAKFLGFEFRGVGVKGDTEITDASNITWKNQTTGCVRDNRYKSDNSSISYLNANYAALSTDSWCNVVPTGSAATALVAKVAFYDQDGKYVATRYFTAGDAAIKAVSEAKPKASKYEAGKQYTYYIDIINDGGDDTDGDDPDAPLAKIKVTDVKVTDWSPVDGGVATFGK